MILVESTYTVFDMFGGPFHGQRRLESSALPIKDVYCKEDDPCQSFHVYAMIGTSLFYKGAHKSAHRLRLVKPYTDMRDNL